MASITLSFHSEALERTVPLRALVPLEDAPRVPMPGAVPASRAVWQ